MSTILSSLLLMLGTIPVAGMICRIRIARKKPISFGTLVVSACAVPLLSALIATGLQLAPGLNEHKMTPQILLTMLGFMAVVCVLPAGGVVVYYHRRSKEHAAH